MAYFDFTSYASVIFRGFAISLQNVLNVKSAVILYFFYLLALGERSIDISAVRLSLHLYVYLSFKCS